MGRVAQYLKLVSCAVFFPHNLIQEEQKTKRQEIQDRVE